MSKVSFCFPISDYKANILPDLFERAGKSHLLGVLVCGGAFVPDTAEYILQYKDEECNVNWLATIDFLEKSKDCLFFRLNHPLNKNHSKLPTFDEVFEMIDGDEYIRRNKTE